MDCGIQRSRAKVFGDGQTVGSVIVRPVRASDAAQWRAMREALWPGAAERHALEVEAFFADSASRRHTVLVAEYGGALVGFVELSLRAYVEGRDTSPVAYLEGWFVSNEIRRAGVGRALLRAADEWGRAQGCTELVSNAEAGNTASDG
jgi:aminoglycoside 6'-N-acetyltransferase I